MKKIYQWAAIIGLSLNLTGCSMDGSQYQQQSPKLVLEEFFDGNIKGVGLLQDWRGNAIRKFDFTILRQWQGDHDTLEEDFIFYDGE